MAKAKAYDTCIAPQAAYRSCSGAVNVTDRADVQHIGRRLSLRPQTMTYDQRTIHHPDLQFMVTTTVIQIITWTTTYLPTPEEWKAELAWLVEP